jgi:hypothetical protein
MKRVRMTRAGIATMLAAALLLCAVVLVFRPRAEDAAAQDRPLAALRSVADPATVGAEDWSQRRAPVLRAAFQQQIYGELPALPASVVVQREPLALRNLARLGVGVEQWEVRLGESPHRFNMVVVIPRNAPAPLPTVVMEVFCGNRTALPGRPREVAAPLNPVMFICNMSFADPVMHGLLGRYINGPPIREVAGRGYALAILYPSDVVADRASLAEPTLEMIGGTPRAGALAVWAVLFSRAYDALIQDTRFDPHRIAIWGHSRHGKAALLAGAFDHRFAAIVAHQSGRFGAAPLTDGAGERRDQILANYGYWFVDREDLAI